MFFLCKMYSSTILCILTKKLKKILYASENMQKLVYSRFFAERLNKSPIILKVIAYFV